MRGYTPEQLPVLVDARQGLRRLRPLVLPKSPRRRSPTARSSTPPPPSGPRGEQPVQELPRRSTPARRSSSRLEAARPAPGRCTSTRRGLVPLTGIIHAPRAAAVTSPTQLRDNGCTSTPMPRTATLPTLLVHRAESAPCATTTIHPADRTRSCPGLAAALLGPARRRTARSRNSTARSASTGPRPGLELSRTPCSWSSFDEHGGTYDHVAPPRGPPA